MPLQNIYIVRHGVSLSHSTLPPQKTPLTPPLAPLKLEHKLGNRRHNLHRPHPYGRSFRPPSHRLRGTTSPSARTPSPASGPTCKTHLLERVLQMLADRRSVRGAVSQ